MADRTHNLEAGTGFGVGEIQDRALELAATAREQFSIRSKALAQLIVQRPTQALAAALGMGVLLGWLIKRR